MIGYIHEQTGLKLYGQYENDRNTASKDLIKAITREAFGVEDVIVGHHIVFVQEKQGHDGFCYTVTQELAAIDTMVFDHEIAAKLWPDSWRSVLALLACEPVETRDALLGRLYNDPHRRRMTSPGLEQE